MAITQVDLDETLLARAAEVLGTSTMRDTVNEALLRVVNDDMRRRHLDDLAGGALSDLSDPETMGRAWG